MTCTSPNDIGVNDPVAIKAIDHAKGLIFTRFEIVSMPERLFYHTTGHTHGVIKRALRIADALRLSEREKLLVIFAAAYHDTVQKWEPVEKSPGTIVRHRFTVKNERESALEAVAAMEASDGDFTEKEMVLVASAIQATLPAWDMELQTVRQPLLTPESHPVIRAVALADLGEAGMDPDAFLISSNRIFAEDQISLMKRVVRTDGPDEIPLDEQEEYRERFISWLKTQPAFAQGRKALLATECGTPEVAALFDQFDRSIMYATRAVGSAQQMDFVRLMTLLIPDLYHG